MGEVGVTAVTVQCAASGAHAAGDGGEPALRAAAAGVLAEGVEGGDADGGRVVGRNVGEEFVDGDGDSVECTGVGDRSDAVRVRVGCDERRADGVVVGGEPLAGPLVERDDERVVGLREPPAAGVGVGDQRERAAPAISPRWPPR